MMKEKILDIIEDLVSDFVFYDRKEDDEVDVDDLQKAVRTGIITREEMVQKFSDELAKQFTV